MYRNVPVLYTVFMAETGKLWIILNPTAKKGKAARQHPKIERFLREQGCNFEIYLTKSPGDALDVVRNLPLGADDAVVAAGGDGTCNEVANGLLRRTPPAPGVPPILGVLPIGRGNDFSFTPGIPYDLEKALKVLIAGKLRPIDAGMVKGGLFPEGRYFVNGVGIGFDTQVVFNAAKLKIKSGIGYAIGAIINVIRYESSPVIRIRYDEHEITLPAAIVSVVNGRRMGNIFYIRPDALLDDGFLDICYVKHPPTRLKMIDVVLHYTKGTQTECEGVFADRGLNFHLTALEGGMAAHCDGETVCYDGAELEITCIPGALRLISPAAAP